MVVKTKIDLNELQKINKNENTKFVYLNQQYDIVKTDGVKGIDILNAKNEKCFVPIFNVRTSSQRWDRVKQEPVKDASGRIIYDRVSFDQVAEELEAMLTWPNYTEGILLVAYRRDAIKYVIDLIEIMSTNVKVVVGDVDIRLVAGRFVMEPVLIKGKFHFLSKAERKLYGRAKAANRNANAK